MRMIKLLEEILQAGGDAKISLDMGSWVDNDDDFCATSCCMCGDVAIARMGETSDPLDVDTASDLAEDFSYELDEACEEIFGSDLLVRSVYSGSSFIRSDHARESKLLTDEELRHPHLTRNHHSREIAHDYVRLVIKKVREKTS